MDLIKANEEKGTMTSLELLEIINKLRAKENKKILKHYQLLRKIKDEFTGDFKIVSGNKKSTGQNILLSKYLDSSGKENEMCILTFNQVRQMGARESKAVRCMMFEYMDFLENEIEQARERERQMVRSFGKAVRQLETDTIKRFLEQYEIPKARHHIYYRQFTNLAYLVLGFNIRNKLKREEMSHYELALLQQVESVINMKLMENMALNKPYKEIYRECKGRAFKFYTEVKHLYIGAENKEAPKLIIE